MAAPSVIGTPVNAMYTDPISITPGASAVFALAATKMLPGGTIRTVTATYDGNAMDAYTYQWDDAVNPFNGISRHGYGGTIGTGSKSIDFTASGGQINPKVAATFLDVNTGSPYLGTTDASGASATTASASLTGGTTNDLAVCILIVQGTRTISAGAGETIVTQRGEDNETIALITKAGGASVSFAPTWTTAAGWGTVAFYLQGSGGPAEDTLVQPVGLTNGSGVPATSSGSLTSTLAGLSRLVATVDGVALDQVVVITKT